jgi:hypothetical protein
VADRSYWLAALNEVPDEPDSRLVQPQLVGIDSAAGQYQGVIVLDRGLGDQSVNRKRAGRLEIVVPGLDFPLTQGQQVGIRTGLLQGLPRLLHFYPLNAVSGQYRHSFTA